MGLLGINSTLPFVNELNGVSTLYPASITLDDFKARVIADGGTFEAGDCLLDNLVYLYNAQIGTISAFDAFKLILTANAYKANVMYAVKPNTSAGDFPFTRTSAAYRTDSAGLLELMATGVPRLDYTGTYGNCPVWLFEPERTNLILDSHRMSGAPWSTSGSGTGSAPVLLSFTELDPFGDPLACKYFFNAGAGTSTADRSILNQFVNVLNATTYTSGFWAKGEVGGEQIVFRHVGAGDYSLITLTTEWEYYFVSEFSTGTVVNYLIEIRKGYFAGLNDSATIYLSGAQVEQGASPTSSITTLSSTDLRPEDGSTRSDLQSGGYLGATSGAFYIDYENTSQAEASASKEIEVSGGGAVDAIQLQASVLSGSVYPLTYRKVIGGVATTLFTPSYSPANIRALFVYDATTLSIWMNGTLVVDSVDFTRANNALDTFDILGGGLYRKAIRLLDFSDSTPTDAQAQGLTGFSSLNDYLSFIGYASDDPSLYVDYL